MKKRIGSWLSILLVLAMVLGNTAGVSAITTVNLSGDNQVSLQTATGNFVVKLKSASDTMELYQLAEVQWDAGQGTYLPLSWMPVVGNWISSNAITKIRTYTTPAILASATQVAQTEFYEALMADSALLANANLPKVAAEKINLVQGESIQWNVTDQSLGQYLVVAKATEGNPYQPLVVNLVPEQSGPSGNWYLPEVVASIKYSSLTLDKKINEKDWDLVAIGDEVDFTIETKVPTYDIDPGGKYTYVIDDDMSAAFAYVKDSLVIEGFAENGDSISVPSSYYTAVVSSEVVVYTCPTSGHGYFNVYQVKDGTKYHYYFLKDGMMNLLLADATSNSTDVTKAFKSYQALTGDTINHSMQPTTIEKNLFNINFKWAELENAGIKNIKISYKAVVTTSAAVGKDTNTNTAYLYYEKDASKTITHTEDTVKAWTYGLNVIKVDGTAGTTTYLSGAIFTLYKKSGVFCKTGSIGDNSDYTWDDDVNVAAGPDIYVATGSAIGTKGDLKTALTYYSDKSIGTMTITNKDIDHSSGAHDEIELYVAVSEEITSTNTAAGVVVNGLNVGEYLLQENIAPSGYNKLNEVILFSINAVDETAANADGGSYKAFIADDSTKYTTGIYPITVKNYSGIQLPETGGSGTYIFTACGILLMIGAIVLIVLKSRKKNPVTNNVVGSNTMAATMSTPKKESIQTEENDTKGDDWV